jgi:hypothetical protein
VNKLAKLGIVVDCCGWHGMNIRWSAIVECSLQVLTTRYSSNFTMIYANLTTVYAYIFEWVSHINKKIHAAGLNLLAREITLKTGMEDCPS